MSYYYFNNKYPSSLYTQKIVFEEHINSVLHNEILRPLSTRIIELISYKYDELLRVNKKLEMLLEENLLYNEKNNESRKPEIMGGGAFGFELEPFYDFNIFNRYKEIVKNSTQGNLFISLYEEELLKFYDQNEIDKIKDLISSTSIITKEEELIIEIKSNEIFSIEDTESTIQFLTDLTMISMISDFNDYMLLINKLIDNSLKLSNIINKKKIIYLEKNINI